MTDVNDEWRTAVEKSLDEVNDDLDFLCIRHSALEWFVEQVVANLLLRSSPREADRFLDEMSAEHGRSWLMGADGPQPVPDALQVKVHQQIVHIAEKIRRRVRTGRSVN